MLLQLSVQCLRLKKVRCSYSPGSTIAIKYSGSDRAINNPSQTTQCLSSMEAKGEIWLAAELKYQQPFTKTRSAFLKSQCSYYLLVQFDLLLRLEWDISSKHSAVLTHITLIWTPLTISRSEMSLWTSIVGKYAWYVQYRLCIHWGVILCVFSGAVFFCCFLSPTPYTRVDCQARPITSGFLWMRLKLNTCRGTWLLEEGRKSCIPIPLLAHTEKLQLNVVPKLDGSVVFLFE